MKTYLYISYQQKDQAKKAAHQNGTRINWDGEAKKWYWEGDGELPECLQAYRWQATPAAYAQRKASYNDFINAQAGQRYQHSQEELMAKENGYNSVEEMHAANAAIDAKYAPTAEELARLAAEAQADLADPDFYR